MAKAKYKRDQPSIYQMPVRDEKGRSKWLGINPGQVVELDDEDVKASGAVARGRLSRVSDNEVATEAKELKPGVVDYGQPSAQPQQQPQSRGQQQPQHGRGGR